MCLQVEWDKWETTQRNDVDVFMPQTKALRIDEEPPQVRVPNENRVQVPVEENNPVRVRIKYWLVQEEEEEEEGGGGSLTRLR